MLSELQDLAPLLGVEFADIAIVDASTIPAMPSGCAFGFALPAGRSPLDDRALVALNFALIEAEAVPGRVDACERIVLYHELGHIASLKPLVWSADDVEFVGDRMPEVRNRAIARGATLPEPEVDHPDASHGRNFLRSAIHLYGRGEQLGIEAPLNDLVGEVGRGWLSDLADYLRVLRGEILAMRGDAFADILASEPPAAFTELWQSDVARYHQNEEIRCNYLRQREESLRTC